MLDYMSTGFSQLNRFFLNNMGAIKLLVTREAVLLMLYMAVSAMTINVFMQTRSLEEGSKDFGLAAMLNGTAERPYVYRQLLPIIANHAAELIPEQDHEAFVKYHLDKYKLRQHYFERAKYKNNETELWTPSYAIKFHIVYLAIFLSLLGLAYALRLLAMEIIPDQPQLAVTAPLFFLSMLPISFMHGNFYYDFPELFFLAVMLLAAIKGYYYLWVILLPLAVLNKESNILVPILYLPIILHNSGAWRKKASIAAAVTIALAIYFFIKSVFSDNPGETTIFQFWKNIEFWSNLRNYFLWHDFYVPLIPFPRGANAFLIVLILAMVSAMWSNLQNWVKWLFVMSLAVNVPLFILFCATDEMRNLSFIFLPLFLIVTQSLSRLLREPLQIKRW